MFERFTDRARRVLVLAQEEARHLDHDFIGTEHLLLGLIHEGDGVAAKALASFGVTLETVRPLVQAAIGEGVLGDSDSPQFTPRAKKVLELSLREAIELGHSYIGTEHLLLGLVSEGDGVAAQVLASLGADLRLIRMQVEKMLSGQQGKEGISVVQRSRSSGLNGGDTLLLKLLWNSKMVREPQNEAEQSIWDALTERFASDLDDER